MNESHIVHLKIRHKMEMTILHTTYGKDGKIGGITTTQHHLDHHTQTVLSKTFTIVGQPGQVIGFIKSIYVSIPIMSFMHMTLMKITNKHNKMPGQQY